MPAIEDIEQAFIDVRASYQGLFSSAPTLDELRRRRATLLGKTGPFTNILHQMNGVPSDQKREMGERVNAFRREIEEAYHQRETVLLSVN